MPNSLGLALNLRKKPVIFGFLFIHKMRNKEPETNSKCNKDDPMSRGSQSREAKPISV